MSRGKIIEMLNKDKGESDLAFKIIILGDSFVGKSCLTLKAIKGSFEKEHKTTVGFEFLNYTVNIEDYNIKLQIWDTCGQETYRSLISSFYHSSALAILVYSIDSQKSFNSLEMWLNEIKTKGNPDVIIVLVGNKSDLENKREVTKEMANDWCENNNVKTFMETSAKNGENIRKLFFDSAKILFEQYKKKRYRISTTSSMKNVLEQVEIYDKERSKEINISDGDNSVKRRKKWCCI